MTNNAWLERFDLQFFQTSQQIYRKVQYTEKVFGNIHCLPCFARKMVLYSFSKFYIFEPLTNIQLHRRFKLGFWKTSEQVYKKVQHLGKIFAKFQSHPRFPRKMVLYSLTKLFIERLGTNI